MLFSSAGFGVAASIFYRNSNVCALNFQNNKTFSTVEEQRREKKSWYTINIPEIVLNILWVYFVFHCDCLFEMTRARLLDLLLSFFFASIHPSSFHASFSAFTLSFLPDIFAKFGCASLWVLFPFQLPLRFISLFGSSANDSQVKIKKICCRHDFSFRCLIIFFFLSFVRYFRSFFCFACYSVHFIPFATCFPCLVFHLHFLLGSRYIIYATRDNLHNGIIESKGSMQNREPGVEKKKKRKSNERECQWNEIFFFLSCHYVLQVLHSFIHSLAGSFVFYLLSLLLCFFLFSFSFFFGSYSEESKRVKWK